MKRTPIKRGNKPLQSKGGLHRHGPITKQGKAAERWKTARKEVVDFFTAIDLPWTCEARLEGCTGEMFLTLAHSKKRRDIKDAAELKEVALLCSTCHDIVDAWKKDHTEYYIKQLIEKRK